MTMYQVGDRVRIRQGARWRAGEVGYIKDIQHTMESYFYGRNPFYQVQLSDAYITCVDGMLEPASSAEYKQAVIRSLAELIEDEDHDRP